MAIDTNPYRCDVCGVNKQESNHWFLGCAQPEEGGVGVPTIGFVVIKWDAKAATMKGIAHICGIGCAGRWLTAQLQTLV